MINNFKNDLEYSLKHKNEINDLYYNVFPDLVHIETVNNLILQKKGIDKILHFKSGKKILIDEKKRRKDYGDILLEEYSVWENNIGGWLKDEKRTDYIVYIIMPTEKIFLLPYLLLRRAWIRNYSKWLDEYGRVFAKNNGYKTSNIPVPTKVLLNAIRREMCIKFRIKQKLINISQFFNKNNGGLNKND